MKLSEQLQRHVDLHPPGPIMLEHYASEAAAMEDQIAAVKAALREYHRALDTYGEYWPSPRRLVTRVETALNTPYVPGATMPKLDAFRRQWTGSDGDSGTTATETGAES